MFWNPDATAEEAPLDDVEWAPPVPDAVDLVVETQSIMSVLTAQQYTRVDAMRRELLADAGANGSALTGVVERSIRLELALALGITEAAADILLSRAEALVHRYPSALDSLGGARMTSGHANALVDALDAIEPELRGELLPALVVLAEAQPLGTFRRRMRALIETARIVTLPERYKRAVLDRRVVLESADDAMAWLHLFMPAVEAQAIHGRATAIAKVLAAQPDELRTLDQLRTDVLSDLLIDGTTAHTPVEARGIRATVAVTVPALALLSGDGADDSGGSDGSGPDGIGSGGNGDVSRGISGGHDSNCGDHDHDHDHDGTIDDTGNDANCYGSGGNGPSIGEATDAAARTVSVNPAPSPPTPPSPVRTSTCETGSAPPRPAGGFASVEGVGPIPIDRARELCGGADGWMRILTHPETGMVLSVGRDQYRPPASLRRLVRWRADTCMAPGCSIPAARCQLDHNVAWENGGSTALTNLLPFCQGHHTIKHHGGWTIEHIPDSGGAVRWTSPTGRQYRVDPERKVPSFAPVDASPPPF